MTVRIAHLCCAAEVDSFGCGDLRTARGRRNEVLKSVRELGGFTVFWVTDNYLRAKAADYLIERGIIVPGDERPYPWCSYQLAEEASREA